MKLLIVDGHNLMFQMFFGMPARIYGKGGRAIHGTLGFVGALIKIIKMISPTHVAVLFDGEHENARTEISVDYKANRPDFSDVPEEESPFAQLGDIYRALDCMGIAHCEIADGEADDAVSSFALAYGGEAEIVISSFDSDFFQLINENVSVLRYRGDKTCICDIAYINEKCGISPSQYADFKSLTGDTADNIKGAYKIGPKTAAELIRQFGSLESIIERADEIAKPSVRESVAESADRLRDNYRLIRLDDRAAVPFAMSEMKYTYSGVTTNEILTKIGLR